MLSKSMHRFTKERFKHSSDMELSSTKEKLCELIRSPLSSVDEKFLLDAKRMLNQVEAEIDQRSERALMDKLELQEMSASPVKPRLYPVR